MSTTTVSTTAYVYRPEALLRLKQRRKQVLAPVLVMMMTLIIALSLVMFAPMTNSFRSLFALVTFFSIAVAYIALATTRSVLERTERAWSNYRLVVDGNGIERGIWPGGQDAAGIRGIGIRLRVHMMETDKVDP